MLSVTDSMQVTKETSRMCTNSVYRHYLRFFECQGIRLNTDNESALFLIHTLSQLLAACSTQKQREKVSYYMYMIHGIDDVGLTIPRPEEEEEKGPGFSHSFATKFTYCWNPQGM